MHYAGAQSTDPYVALGAGQRLHDQGALDRAGQSIAVRELFYLQGLGVDYIQRVGQTGPELMLDQIERSNWTRAEIAGYVQLRKLARLRIEPKQPRAAADEQIAVPAGFGVAKYRHRRLLGKQHLFERVRRLRLNAKETLQTDQPERALIVQRQLHAFVALGQSHDFGRKMLDGICLRVEAKQAVLVIHPPDRAVAGLDDRPDAAALQHPALILMLVASGYVQSVDPDQPLFRHTRPNRAAGVGQHRHDVVAGKRTRAFRIVTKHPGLNAVVAHQTAAGRDPDIAERIAIHRFDHGIGKPRGAAETIDHRRRLGRERGTRAA